MISSVFLAVLITHGPVEADLTLKEDRSVRSAIYNQTVLVGSSELGGPTEILIPDNLIALHKAKPKSVLSLLQNIVEAANPDDSHVAAAYYVGLVAGARAGVVVVTNFKKDSYDSWDKRWETSPRKHWLNVIQYQLRKK